MAALEREIGARLFERERGGLRLTHEGEYLTSGGAAFEYTPCWTFVRTRLDYALQAALCNWWVLHGWDEDDSRAVRDAILRAGRPVI